MDVRILGELEVRRDGQVVDLGSHRQQALLVRLLVNPNEIVATDRLIDDLWDGDPPETARHGLHVYISRLRKILGSDVERLSRQGTGYRLCIDEDELDASRFERLASKGRASLARADPEIALQELQEALLLWRGSAFAGFDEAAFARAEAIRLEDLRLTSLEQRIWADLELGRHAEVIVELRDLATDHPFREAFWEQLMLGLYRCGRQADALRIYQEARMTLATELGIEPGPALQRIEQQILTHDPDLEHKFRNPSVAAATLPLQRTSFIGRTHELSQAGELLSESRLLTLTGAPGSGKTRLALRLAMDHAAEFVHGTIFVALAPISNPQLMTSAISRALGVRDLPDKSPIDALKAVLRNRRMLIVLDNFEQILPAASQVGELLDSSPALKIVATSRAPLGITGEQEFPVPPLTVPPIDDLESDAIAGYDGVALFLARTRAAAPDFELTESNAPIIAEITSRLDGLPLAIELAAARMKLLTPQDLLSHIGSRLALRLSGPADGVDRHHTMSRAIAWSYDLLESDQQTLFRSLSVFAGGFNVEGAAAIGGLSNDEALEGLDALLSHSLLYRPADVGEARFAMLELIREFAAEELTRAGGQRGASGLHAGYCLRLAQEIEPELTGDQQRAAMVRLSEEQENIRAALRYATVAPDPDLGLLLAGSTWRYWESSGQLTEGKRWLERLLDINGASNPSRAKGLIGIAGLAYWQGDYGQARDLYRKALDLYRSSGDRYNEAETLFGLSMAAGLEGDATAGDELAIEAQAIFEELGARDGVGKATMARAAALHGKGDHTAARSLWKEALAISTELGDRHLAITQRIALAIYAFEDGEIGDALTTAYTALDQAVDLENMHLTLWMLDFIAAFTAPIGPEDAIRLAGAVKALQHPAGGGMRLGPIEIEDAGTVAERALNPETIDRAWAEGQAMTLDQAIQYAGGLRSNVPSEPIE